MKLKLSLSLLVVLLGFSACNRVTSEDDDKNNWFRLKVTEESVIIKGKGFIAGNVFREPLFTDASAERYNWTFKNRTNKEEIFASVEGTTVSDIFLSDAGQLERRAWISKNKDLVAFQHVYTNITDKNVRLKALFPLNITGRQNFFGTKGHFRVLTQKSEKNGLPGVEIPEKGKVITSDPFLVINDPESNDNLLIGAQSYYLHLFELNLDCDVDDNGDQLISLQANCNFEGITVPPGTSRESQWIVVSRSKDPHNLISEFSARTNRLHGREKPAEWPPSVYCAFYYYGLGYNEKYLKNDIAAFKADPLPFDIFQIDACWQQNYGHDFEYDETVFPSGMKTAADQIRSLGYKPGIWTAPYIVNMDWTNPETDIAGNHPDWLLKNSKGELCRWLSYYILDPTSPGVTAYLEESYRKLADEWGFEYFKFDFMRAIFSDPDAQFYDKCSTSLEAYRKGLESIRRGVGNAYISVCGGHYGASYGIADSQRSGSDTRSVWNEKELPKYRQNILRTWMSDYWHVDPDAMSIRRQGTALPGTNNKSLGVFTNDEARTNMLNQYIGGGMVCFGEDFSTIDNDRKDLYRHVLPSVNSPSKALDIFDPFCPNIMLTEIKPVCEDLPSWITISIVNWSDTIKDYNILLDESITGNLEGDRFIVSEFFTQKVPGLINEGQMMAVYDQKPHQSQLFRVMPWNGQEPVLVNTDLHLSGGGVEVSDWNTDNGKIRGSIKTRWNYPVRLTVAIPDEGEQGYRIEVITVPPGEHNFLLDYE